MKRINKYMIAVAMFAFSGAALAQGLNSGYFTNDFKYRHDLNPAFGNEQSYVSMPGLGNLNVKTQANFGYKDVLYNNPDYPANSDKKMTTFMNPNIEDGLSGFSKGNNRLTAEINENIFSAGFKAFHGYNTIEMNVRVALGASLPYELFEFARNTGNQSYDIGDISLQSQSFVEFALGHSHQINDKLRVGGKLKFLFGVGRADFVFKDVKADLSSNNKWTISGDAQADVSAKGFKYESETKDYNQQTAGHQSYERVKDVKIDGAGLGGFGMAIDMGAIYKINEDITVSAALLDLGFISWKNDVQATNNSKSFTFDGFHDTSVTSDGNNTIDDQNDKYGDQISDFANLQDKGDNGSRTTGIGATMNFGCEYILPAYRNLSFGLLSSTRINGKYSWTEGRLSANVAPLKWIDGGFNFAVSSFAASMGWILNIHPKGFNFFLGMDHILGKMSKEGIPLSSNASVSMGINFTW